MKKIYSIVLMATALLIGTNAWGQYSVQLVNESDNSKSGSYETLQKAIDAIGPGQTGTITLDEDQGLEAGIIIPHLTASDTTGGKRIANLERQHITIDLNGHDISTNSTVKDACFVLLKGELNIIGSGEIKRAEIGYDNNWNRGAIVVGGTDGMKDGYTGNWPTKGGNVVLAADRVDRSKQEWSTLYIGNGVTVRSNQVKTFGIGIQEIGSSVPSGRDFSRNFLGYSCAYSGATAPMWNADSSNDQWSCFGVKIVIDGKVYGERRGVNVLGNINQTPGTVEGVTSRKYTTYPFYDHYFPYVKIGKTAEVSCKASGINDDGNGGIYLGGWAVIDIEGYVHGQTGVMVKSGDVAVSDGYVKSDDTDGTSVNGGDYHSTVSGSGIFVVSSSSYAGESNVAISGDSKIEGAKGSAIIDVLGDGANNTKVTHVEITGGTIIGGDDGAITLTPSTKESNVTKVEGGTVDGKVTIKDGTNEGAGSTVDVSTLVPNNTDYHTTEVTITDPDDPTQTKVVVVISQGAAPTGDANVAAGHNATSRVNWTGASEDITDDLTLAELIINQSTAQTLTVKAGKTLTIGQVTLGEKAQIVVEPGAKFIVTNKQGIVAPVVDNIILKHNSNTGKYATFLFNPAVESNRHPNATVEFTTNSWRESSSSLQWEWFGIPTYNKAKSITSTGQAYVAVFENNAWTNLGFIGGTYNDNPAVLAKLNMPFAAYDLLANRLPSAAAPEISISGEMVGNVDGALNANLRWSPFANSYTAEVDAEIFVNALKGSSNIADAIYVATQNANGTITWNVKTGDLVKGLKLQPMQAFMLNNPNNIEEATINYASMVYTPATTPNLAPRRFATVDNTTKVTINVANEEGTWDDVDLRENEDAKSYEKYLNDDVNIYVADGQKNDYVVAEDLENTYVGFSTVKGGNFTISFANVEGREFTLVDLETGAQTLIVEGNTYAFNAAANTTNDYRFQIINTNGIMTGIENAEAVKSAKGIYTITGIYVGEMNLWNALPAGVYVVNGEKRVK